MGSFDNMKPQHVPVLGRAGCLLIAAALAFAAAVLFFQCVYWLRFATWFDWTDPDGPKFPGNGWATGAWKGANATFDLFLSAPVQLAASITGFILVALYVLVRSSARR